MVEAMPGRWIGQGVIRTLKMECLGIISIFTSPPVFVVVCQQHHGRNSYSPFETCRTLVDLRAGDAHLTARLG
jgi:predicted ATP-grasp superfamily ATP-dependent carboligase